MMEVLVLKEGVKDRSLRGKVTYRNPVSSSVTLIKTNVNIIVDTGCRGDTQLITDRLAEAGTRPSEVDYVVNTHWHPDHTSNNHLFTNAKLIIGESMWLPNKDANCDSWEAEARKMVGVEIVRTPGHTPLHISVMAYAGRRYAIAGDAFYEEDLRKGSIPDAYSSKRQFRESALKIINAADVIIPGHGRILEVDGDARRELAGLVEKLS